MPGNTKSDFNFLRQKRLILWTLALKSIVSKKFATTLPLVSRIFYDAEWKNQRVATLMIIPFTPYVH